MKRTVQPISYEQSVVIKGSVLNTSLHLLIMLIRGLYQNASFLHVKPALTGPIKRPTLDQNISEVLKGLVTVLP